MGLELRPITAGEIPDFFTCEGAAFGLRYSEEEIAQKGPGFEPERSLVAFDGGDMVATSGVCSLQVTVPGPAVVPAGGVSYVGVLPTHRRRGILTAMMRRQLDGMIERGEAIALLTASEGAIYGRFGFGPATAVASYELARSGARWRDPIDDAGSIRLLEVDHAIEAFPPVFDEVRRNRVGDVSRPAAWWNDLLRDTERGRGGVNAMFLACHLDTSRVVDGYAIYRVVRSDPDAVAVVRVEELCAAAEAAELALWAHLCDIDLTDRIELVNRPVDEPLRWRLADTRQLRLTESVDHIWARLVDLPSALCGRSYEDGEIVLEIADEFCPWNVGRWQLSTGPSGADVSRTSRGPDLAIDAADLASTFLGGSRFQVLARGGRVVEHTGGALARADRLFSAATLPYCATDF